VNLDRRSGILLHPTSLPSGRLDGDAYRFVDWLAAAGQSWWQILPLGPPGRGASPYTARSAFAGSPALLAEPTARVPRDEAGRFRASNAYWIDDWLATGGSLADQVRFDREWRALRRYAADRGVRIFGDMPIYVGWDSVDHRSRPELFQAGLVAGVPPDAFTSTGQLWGNPLYDWPAMRADRYRWWVERFRRSLELVDLIRLDHFRGFVAYWAVRAGDDTAASGRWRRGPGSRLFDAVTEALGRELPVVAEDLGVITPAVTRLRTRLGFPAMVVLQFAFGDDADTSVHRPENHPVHAVAYTGTHDNDTTRGWWESLDEAARARSGLDPGDPVWSALGAVWRSRAALAVAPLQDVLELGSEARMNHPGTGSGNWTWRYRAADLTPERAERLRALTVAAGRR
jgi:4-alpha-glucanotransferase